MSEYYEIDSKQYMNIFGCPGIDQLNIQIYLDAKELIE